MAGIRFFRMSFADINRAAVTLTLSNNDAEKLSLINRDPLFTWQSIGSSDSSPVTLTVDFGTARTIDTLILTLNNLKNFQLEYLNGSSVWTQIFAETANTAETYYRKFTPVSTQQVRLTMNTTRTADAQKTVQDFIITQEIGQLVGYPPISFQNNTGNTLKKKMLNGKDKLVLSGFLRVFKLNFTDHVGTADRDLFNTLASLTEAFLLWPCGGDATQFAHGDIGYRLQDIYLVAVDNGYTHQFTQNLYRSGFSAPLTLSEVT